MAGIGYGTMDGQKYWLIQNSWGLNWGDVGTIKIIRGINIHGIEDGVFYFRAWVDGASQPPLPVCQDAALIDGLRMKTGGQVPCSMVAAQPSACEHPEFGRRIKLSCPASCNACPTPEAPPAPTPPPRPQPAPVPTAPPATQAPEPATPSPTVPSTSAPEPTPVPAPPAQGKQIIELGSSSKDKKCVHIGDLVCEVLNPPCEGKTTDEYGFESNCYDYFMEGDNWDRACVSLSGGWKKNVTLSCEKY